MKKLKIEINVTEDTYTYAKNRLLEYLIDCFDIDDPDCADAVKAIRDLEANVWSRELYDLLSREIDTSIDVGDSFLRVYINTVMTYLN